MTPTQDAARPLRIVTSGAQAALVAALLPRYGRAVEVAYGSSLGGAHDSIPTRLAQGERFDLYFLAEAAHRAAAGAGQVAADFVPLVRSRIGAAVAEGALAPDISTPEALRQALLGARSVAHAASASGIYLSTEVFPALGIAAQMQAKARKIHSERVGRVVARGEAELGFQQMSELLPIAGIRIVGALPPEFDRSFVFGAAFGTDPAARPAAEAFLAFLRAEATAAELARWGLLPA